MRLTGFVSPIDSEEKINWADAKETLMTPRFYVHYFAYFFIGSGVASLSLFAPTIVAGLGYKDLDAQLYTVPPYAVAYGVTLFAAWLSDRLKDRGLVAGLSFVAASIAFIISGMIHSKTHLLSHEFRRMVSSFAKAPFLVTVPVAS